VSAYIRDGRAYFLQYLRQMDKTRELPVCVPNQAQYRTSRRIEGLYLLSKRDLSKHHEDSVGCAYTYKYGGVLLEFPYRTLVAGGLTNMITAGRSISSAMDVRGLTRLIAPSAMTGEAAGTAAAIALEKNCGIADIPIAELQRRLEQNGGILHFKD
jgi:hypothetical protein